MVNVAGIAGTVSECQQERSQIKNKEKAMKVLRAKLYSAKLEEETSKRYQTRKLQVHCPIHLFCSHNDSVSISVTNLKCTNQSTEFSYLDIHNCPKDIRFEKSAGDFHVSVHAVVVCFGLHVKLVTELVQDMQAFTDTQDYFKLSKLSLSYIAA